MNEMLLVIASCGGTRSPPIRRSARFASKKQAGARRLQTISHAIPARPGSGVRVDLGARRDHVGSTGDPMTRNPQLPMLSVTDPIKVALLTDDPLLRAGLSSLLAQVGSIEVVESDVAEVALWDAGVDSTKTLARLAELRNLPMPAVAVVGDASHVQPALAAGARGVVLRDNVG